jgi:hypothetical protein
MRLFEFGSSPANNSQELAALSQFLLSRADDQSSSKTISIDAFLKLAGNMGISLTDSQLRNIAQQPPLSGLIANVTDSEILFKGTEEVAPNMSVDQARDTVNTMAKRAAEKPGL